MTSEGLSMTFRRVFHQPLKMIPRLKVARLIGKHTKTAWALIPLAGWGVLIAGVLVAKPQQSSSGKTEDATSESVETVPGDWAPELLYAILSSANPDAGDALYRAAFSASPTARFQKRRFWP